MRVLQAFCSIALALAAVTPVRVAGNLQAQPAPRLVDVQTLGPQVGARIPDFTLVDQSG